MVGLNNVLNIRNSNSRWLGSSQGDKGFVDFVSIGYCIRAGFLLIARSYRKKGFVTVTDIITRFAPPIENDTSKYISFVCDKANVKSDVPLDFDSYISILQSMCKFETGYVISRVKILSLLHMFNIYSL